jgi:hypothetical protein
MFRWFRPTRKIKLQKYFKNRYTKNLNMYQELNLLDKIGLRGKPTMIHRYAICMTLCIYSEGVPQITSVYLAYNTYT